MWPDAIAPFVCAIAPINAHKSERLREAAEALYAELIAAGYDVLLHDGRERPGVMFADLDLLGIPHRFVLSDRGLDQGQLEYKARTAAANEFLPIEQAVSFLRERSASTERRPGQPSIERFGTACRSIRTTLRTSTNSPIRDTTNSPAQLSGARAEGVLDRPPQGCGGRAYRDVFTACPARPQAAPTTPRLNANSATGCPASAN